MIRKRIYARPMLQEPIAEPIPRLIPVVPTLKGGMKVAPCAVHRCAVGPDKGIQCMRGHDLDVSDCLLTFMEILGKDCVLCWADWRSEWRQL